MNLNRMILRIVLFFVFLKCLTACAYDSDINWFKLNLTDNQKAKLKAIDESWKAENQNRYARLKTNKSDLKKAIYNQKSSNQNIRMLYVQIIHDECVLKDKAIECFLKKRSLLDTNQLKNLNKK